MTSRLWLDAMDLRAGLRCMQAVVKDSPWMAYDYERNLEDLRKSRRTRRWFLKIMRARPFALNHYRQGTTP
jgi:hypothetical protein